MKTHYTIPFFIPFYGCPHKCIFCDQNKITGKKTAFSENIENKIKKYLAAIPKSNSHIEVGFFGGTFTGLPIETQKKFLAPVQYFIESGLIKGIRLSTRPDFVNNNILDFLNQYGVSCIELGIQSMSNTVLSASKRGHSKEDSIRASKLIIKNGFRLVHQIMVGLPKSNYKKEYKTAQYIYELGAKEARIYPVIVIKNTELETLWRSHRYKPLREEDAIERCAKLILYLESKDINIIRCGLHPSEGLINGTEYLAGPFLPSFRQKAESRIFHLMLEYIIQNGAKEISFNPNDEPYFYGYKRSNFPLINKIPLTKKEHAVSKGSLKTQDGILTRKDFIKHYDCHI
jgi:histone acetyltransferase (RNA polymerase elongator complex component)